MKMTGDNNQQVIEAINGQSTAMAEAIAKMVQALVSMPAPQVTVTAPDVIIPAPVVNVQPPSVTVEAPQITVQVPSRKRKAKIIYNADGRPVGMAEE